MTYYTGTWTSTNPAMDAMTTLDGHFTSNGWTFVETYTSGTDVTSIYKSPAASNSAATDFYVGVNRTATNVNTIAFVLFEQWDSANKRALKYAPNGTPTAGSNIPASDYTVNDSTGVLPSATTSNASLFKGATMTLIASPSVTTYHVNINVDRVIWTTDRGPGGYVGLGDALVTNPLPLVVISFAGSNSNQNTIGAMTREPLQTVAASGNWHVMFLGGATTVAASLAGSVFGVPQVFAGSNTAYVATADVYTGSRLAQRLAISSSRSTITSTVNGTWGFPMLLKDVLGTLDSSGNAVLDTMSYTSGGTTYNFVKAYLNTSLSIVPPVYIPKQ